MVFSVTDNIGNNYIYYFVRSYSTSNVNIFGPIKYILDKPAKSIFVSSALGYYKTGDLDLPKFGMIVANLGDGPRDGEDFI